MTAAERTRRCRARRELGLIPLTVDVPDVGLPQFLAGQGYLDDPETEDRAVLRAALEAYLRDVSSPAAYDVTPLLRDILRNAMIKP